MTTFTLALNLHFPPTDMPDVDTDILILAEGDEEMQLGAYIGEESDGPVWNDAQGEIVPRVLAWAEMPVVKLRAPVVGRIGRDSDLVPLANGRAVNFGGPWSMPK